MRLDVDRSLLCALLLAAFAAGATESSPPPAKERHVTNRVVTFSPESSNAVPEIFLAPGVPTTLIFPLNINEGATRLADPNKLIYKAQFYRNTAVLSPRAELPAGAVVPFTVGLEDGTLVSFILRGATTEADFQVTVEVKLTKPQAPESLQGLKETIARLQGSLDECQASAGSSGIAKIASLVLANEPGSPTARTFEGHRVHALDKQSRLLVEIHHLYRLFGDSYLLLTVENRDPSRVWVLDRSELKLRGGSETSVLKVVAFDTDLKSVAPGETAKVVVAFETPTQQSGQRVSVTLLEKGGSRHVTMEFEP
jgi:uncharacterized protein (TIGR02268 family)